MTIEEMKELVRRLHLDAEQGTDLIYVFYRTPDGLVGNFSISVHSARQRNRKPMTAEQLAELMQQYPDARNSTLVAMEHPRQGLTEWMDTADVCRRLHTTRNTLHKWCSMGLLHPSKLGGRLYYDPAEVEYLVRSNAWQPGGRLDKTVCLEYPLSDAGCLCSDAEGDAGGGGAAPKGADDVG